MMRAYLVTVALCALAFSLASASDPSPLQDFCVALKDSSDSAVFVNGKVCKDPKLAKADDFYFGGLNIAGNTENLQGSNVTTVNFNVGKTNAIAIAGLSSQNAGVITIANAVFGSNPPINPDVLTKAFQLDKNVVQYLQKKF
uniref:Cupin type-1 domain-containing protein n=1 Tax=Fagus sylvatica TaxID=28930 RepID=A0A2N9FLU1_FAGSY